MTIADAASCLDAYISILNGNRAEDLNIPIRSDGSDYTIDDLAEDQKQALAVALYHIQEYCEGDLKNEDITMRLTVAGVAGSGKSTWINTLVSLVRKLFKNNDTVGVYGPTGSAAFNAGGETINRGLGVPIPITTLEISSTKHRQLLNKFADTIAVIIDERSMVEAEKLGCAKLYMNECAHGGVTQKDWGGIPMVILVGDDYQLPAIGLGAFYSIIPEYESTKGYKKKQPAKGQVQCTIEGNIEFKIFAQNTVYLESIKRVNKDQEQLRRILKALRCEEEDDKLSDTDMQRLLCLNLKDKTYTPKEREEIQNNSMYLFATKEPRDQLNNKMLLKANRQGNPVARIKSITENSNGKRVSNNSHYDADRYPVEVLLCKSAKVALNGQNLNPGIGLFHGSLGTIEDIIYHTNQRPEHGDLPAYVLVNFAQYCGKQLVPHSKQSIPITPATIRCRRNCCTRKYIPLSLAYGRTIHTFQGQTVGPTQPGRPENPVKRIIVDPGSRGFEGNNVGLFYTAMSRATTIGNPNDKMSSAIYFDGLHFSQKRITNLTKEQSGRLFKKAQLRQNWVKYMKENNRKRKYYTEKEMEYIFKWATNTRYNREFLKKTIEKNDQKQKKVKSATTADNKESNHRIATVQIEDHGALNKTCQPQPTER
jgi:AAA domain